MGFETIGRERLENVREARGGMLGGEVVTHVERAREGRENYV